MKKVVFKVIIPNDKARQKAMKAVCKLSGIASISSDMKEQKLTIIGDVDPVALASILSKKGHAELVSVGPAKEEKKDEGNKIYYYSHPYYPNPYPYPGLPLYY